MSQHMHFAQYFVLSIAIQDTVAAIAYAVTGKWTLAIYWFFAAGITFTTIFF